MKIELSTVGRDTYTVLVDANELQCDVRKLPYSTWIGTINARTRKINVWTPAASIPRGYKRAALALLETALEGLQVPS